MKMRVAALEEKSRALEERNRVLERQLASERLSQHGGNTPRRRRSRMMTEVRERERVKTEVREWRVGRERARKRRRRKV